MGLQAKRDAGPDWSKRTEVSKRKQTKKEMNRIPATFANPIRINAFSMPETNLGTEDTTETK